MASKSLYGRAALLLTGLLAFAAPPLQAADLINPGEYSFTSTTNGRASKVSYCVTPEKAQLANGDSKSGREAAEREGKGRCTIESYDITGNIVTYLMTCNGTVLAGTTTYHGDGSEGDLTSTRTVKGKEQTDRIHVTAKRLGDCKVG